MASSGSFNTSDYKGRYLVFSWSEISQSVTDNKTTISWTLKSAGESEWRYYKAGGFKVVIDGTTVYSVSTDDRITISENTTIASGTFTFTHNADGTRTFSASAEGGIYTYAVNCTGSGSFTLDTIPRKSTPTLSATTIELGKTLTIYTNRASSAFTHKLYYAWYTGEWNLIASNVGASYAWTVPLNFANNIPDATQGMGTIRCVTYNGSTEIGTAEARFYGTVPASMVPTCSIQVLDATDTKDTYGNLVQGLSKIYVKTTATISYNSTIVSYNVQANGAKYTAAEITTGVLTTAGTTIVTATVTDKRGRTSAAASASFPVLAYTGPNISALAVHRCDEDGTENDQGEYVQAVFSAAITPLNNINSAQYKLRYKAATATSWTEVAFSALAGEYTVTNHAYIFAADGNTSYDIEIVATDDISTATRTTSASTAATLINWHPSGTAFAFGKVSEKENTLEVALDLEQQGDYIQRGNKYVLSTTGDAGVAGFIRMAQISIKSANANWPITFVFTRRQSPMPMTVHAQLSSTETTSELTTITYEGDNYNAYLVPDSELVWSLYVQKGADTDTIALQEWYTTENMAKRIELTFPGDQVSQVPTPYYKATPAMMRSLLDYIYPVGSIYMSYSHYDPTEMFGGTWVRIENAFLWATDESGSIGNTGGEKTHTLTTDEMPSHSHTIFDNSATGTNSHHVWATTWKTTAKTSATKGASIAWTGGSQAHNNMPPYIQVSVWRRTA